MIIELKEGTLDLRELVNELLNHVFALMEALGAQLVDEIQVKALFSGLKSRDDIRIVKCLLSLLN